MRRATRDDLEDIVAMLADDVLGAGREVRGKTLDHCYEAAFNAIEADSNQLLAIFEDDHLVGCLQLTFIPGLSRRGALRGQIEGVRIAAGRRGEGLGTEMFNLAIDECRRRGCRYVQLTADKSRTDAHRFYERLGFVASHEGMKLALD